MSKLQRFAEGFNPKIFARRAYNAKLRGAYFMIDSRSLYQCFLSLPKCHAGVNPVRSSKAELDIICPFQSNRRVHTNKAL